MALLAVLEQHLQVESTKSGLLHALQDELRVHGWHAAPACEIAMDQQRSIGSQSIRRCCWEASASATRCRIGSVPLLLLHHLLRSFSGVRVSVLARSCSTRSTLMEPFSYSRAAAEYFMMKQAIVWSAFCCITIPSSCSGAALSSVDGSLVFVATRSQRNDFHCTPGKTSKN